MIGLHDADKTGFPNLALMKLSAYYKQEGEAVELWRPGLAFYRLVYTIIKHFIFSLKEAHTMLKRLALLLALTLAGCGSGSNPAAGIAPAQLPATPQPNAVASVEVTKDYRQGDPTGEYLVDVTFTTTAGDKLSVEYCSDPIRVGDLVELVPYGVGTTLIFVNDVNVGNVIDRPATEAQIEQPDPEKERQVTAAWEKWKAEHYTAEKI